MTRTILFSQSTAPAVGSVIVRVAAELLVTVFVTKARLIVAALAEAVIELTASVQVDKLYAQLAAVVGVLTTAVNVADIQAPRTTIVFAPDDCTVTDPVL